MTIKTINDLRQERNTLATDMRSMLDKAKEANEGFTAEQRGEYDKKTVGIDRLDKQIEVLEKDLEMQRRELSMQDTENYEERQVRGLNDSELAEHAVRALQQRAGAGHYSQWKDGNDFDRIAVTRAHKHAFDQLLRTHPSQAHAMSSEISAVLNAVQRALGVGTPASAGYTVPQGFVSTIAESKKAFGGIESTAGQAGGVTIIETETGNPLPFITYDETDVKAEFKAENTAELTQQTPEFGVVNLGAFTLSVKPVLVSIELAQDNGVNLEQFLGRKLGEQDGRASSEWFAAGSGTNSARGLSVAAPVGVTTASASAPTYAELLDLEHSVDPAYRSMGAMFVMHDSALRILRGLVDLTGLPLWQPNIGDAFPATFDGFRYVIDNSMPTWATTAEPIVFGNLSSYHIRRVLNPMLIRFDEYYMPSNQYGWKLISRCDGDLIIDTANTTPVSAMTVG